MITSFFLDFIYGLCYNTLRVEGVMNNDILNLLYDASFGKRIFNKGDIDKLYNIFINNYYGVTKYLSCIEEENISGSAVYSCSKKKIFINIYNVVEGLKDEVSKLSLRGDQVYFYYNIQILVILFHELWHVRQMYSSLNSGIIGTLLFYGKTLGNPSGEGDYREYVNSLYEESYRVNPCEREAYVKSSDVVRGIIGNNRYVDINILDYLSYLSLKSKIEGYSSYLCPSEIYFDMINSSLVWEAFPFYDSNKRRMVKKCKDIFSLDDRLTYGLPIDKREYDMILNLRDNVKERILKR